MKGKILDRINSPEDLKKLSLLELQELAEEIREEIIRVVSANGGHLASNLGAVELAIAVHYVFRSPEDRIIWDVGHQSYAHKIITGRKHLFNTIRKYNGLSGFPKITESVHDAFGTGHASTSISAGLGITVAKSIKGCRRRTVAIIGDGSMTGGMAFEALNHAGYLGKDLIVILNDNEMSISPNVGAMSSFLSRKLSSRFVLQLKKEVEQLMKAIPGVGPNIIQFLKKSEDSLIAFFTPGLLFQALKIHYIGPIQGHRIDKLIEAFEKACQVSGPVLVHVLTQKGKGYKPAESDPTYFHGVGPFKVETGESWPSSPDAPPSYTSVFGKTIVRLAEKDPRIIGITAAMKEGTGMDKFADLYPDRFFDVGIAEQHAVTFAAGLAVEGLKPVVAIYSTFLQRAYDQIVHDVALQNLPVVFAMDRGGIVGEDGPTHHGVFDMSYLRHIPNMVVMAPKDENELQHMLFTAVNHNGPISLRYPRGSGIGVPLDSEFKMLDIGKGEVLKEGTDLAFFAIGSTVYPALEASKKLEEKGISAAVINARFVKPLDKELLMYWAEKTNAVITVEENALQGGFGSAVLEMFEENRFFPKRIKRLGIPDTFITHGSQSQLRRLIGIDAEGIFRAAEELLKDVKTNAKVLRAIG